MTTPHDATREALAELVKLYRWSSHATPIDEANGYDSSEREKSAWKAAERALAMLPTPSQPQLLQDCDRGLSKVLASTPGARRLATEAAQSIAAQEDALDAPRYRTLRLHIINRTVGSESLAPCATAAEFDAVVDALQAQPNSGEDSNA